MRPYDVNGSCYTLEAVPRSAQGNTYASTAETSTMTTDLILGTAGHIDHGKTSLIRALTGVDTDRLPEEKKRGITIELGFAELVVGPYRLGIVDVPGHERFVRNMLAGATGMDLALLVVAADDSVNRQTREHLDILRMLDLPAGVLVLTKCDLAEAGWIDLVEEEVRELVQGTFLQSAPLVRTSAATGAGIEELKDVLQQAAAQAARVRAASTGPFRMAIDRCFTIAGHGTVVTGSVGSGQARVGDELVVEPGGISVRIRGIQNHDRTVEEIHRGQRAAINLAGIHHEQVHRGHELASPGHLVPSRCLTVRLDLLADAPRPLKNRSRVRLHLGTAEWMATVRLLDHASLNPGQSGFAQLLVRHPVVATWNQPFVIRTESPVVTIGGGRILDPDATLIKRPTEDDLKMLGQWHQGDETRRAEAALYFANLRDFDPETLPRTAGIRNPQATTSQLRDSGTLLEIPLTATHLFRVHRTRLEQLAERIADRMTRLHEANPLRSVLDRHLVFQPFIPQIPQPVLQEAVRHLREKKKVKETPRGISLVGHAPKLSQNESRLLEWLCRRYQEAGLQVPRIAELQKEAPKNQQSIPQLVAIAVADGELVELSDELVIHRQTLEEIQQKLREAFQRQSEGLTLSQIREVLGTTRKYAVPLCEYLDQTGFTRRDGDVRFLATD